MWHNRTEVGWRPGQGTILAPLCSNPRSFKSKCTVLKKKVAKLLGLFVAPQWFNARVIMPSSLRPWCGTSQQSAQLWNSQSAGCRTTSQNWEITATLVRPCIQNAYEILVRQVLLAKSTGKRPRGRRPKWSNCISYHAWSRLNVELAGLSENAVDCEVFQVLLGLLPPRPSPDEKRACIWITFTLFTCV